MKMNENYYDDKDIQQIINCCFFLWKLFHFVKTLVCLCHKAEPSPSPIIRRKSKLHSSGKVSRQFSPRKNPPWLGLVLVLGLGGAIFLRGNCPRTIKKACQHNLLLWFYFFIFETKPNKVSTFPIYVSQNISKVH